MPTVQGHVQVKLELPAFATCAECHCTYRPRSEDQACMNLCAKCFEHAKYPGEPVISIHVKPRPFRPETDVRR